MSISSNLYSRTPVHVLAEVFNSLMLCLEDGALCDCSLVHWIYGLLSFIDCHQKSMMRKYVKGLALLSCNGDILPTALLRINDSWLCCQVLLHNFCWVEWYALWCEGGLGCMCSSLWCPWCSLYMVCLKLVILVALWMWVVSVMCPGKWWVCSLVIALCYDQSFMHWTNFSSQHFCTVVLISSFGAFSQTYTIPNNFLYCIHVLIYIHSLPDSYILFIYIDSHAII